MENLSVQLSETEILVMQLLADGMRISQIADQLHVSTRMIDIHIKEVRLSLGAKTREQAVAIALAKGFIELNPQTPHF